MSKPTRSALLKSALLRKGVEVSAFADALHVSRQHLWRVASGRSINARIDKAIRDTINGRKS